MQIFPALPSSGLDCQYCLTALDVSCVLYAIDSISRKKKTLIRQNLKGILRIFFPSIAFKTLRVQIFRMLSVKIRKGFFNSRLYTFGWEDLCLFHRVKTVYALLVLIKGRLRGPRDCGFKPCLLYLMVL